MKKRYFDRGIGLFLATLLVLGGCSAAESEPSSTVERQVVESRTEDSDYLMAAQGATLYCRPNLTPATLYSFDGRSGAIADLNTGEPVSLLDVGGTLFYTTAEHEAQGALCRLEEDREEKLLSFSLVSPVDSPARSRNAACGYGNDVGSDRNFYLAGEQGGFLYLYQNTPRGQLDLYRFSLQAPENGLELYCRVEDAQASCAVISGKSLFFLAKNGLLFLDLPDCTAVSLLKESENLSALTSLGGGQAAFLERGRILWWDGAEILPVSVSTGPLTPHLAAREGKLYYGGTGLVLCLDLSTGETEEVEYLRNGRKWNVSNLAVSGEGIFVYCLSDDVDFYDFAAEKWLSS